MARTTSLRFRKSHKPAKRVAKRFDGVTLVLHLQKEETVLVFDDEERWDEKLGESCAAAGLPVGHLRRMF